MSTAKLPKECAIDGLANGLSEAGAFADAESTVLFLPPHAHIHCSALTFLCAWGRRHLRQGRKLLIRGDNASVTELMRLDLHEHLGLAYQKDSNAPNTNPLVPLRLISTEQDVVPVAAEIYSLVREHFDDAASFLPALEWVISEILDNVLRHANAEDPGAVYCEYSPRQKRLDVAICDLGRGIYASLGETTYLYSHGHAITQAVRRGVTRSEDLGQGNGLAGVLEIVKQNSGNLSIWTGNALYRVVAGEEKGFSVMSELPGTGVAFSLNTRVPVDLRDTWIASHGAEYLDTFQNIIPDQTDRVEVVAEPTVTYIDPQGHRVFDIAMECASTGMRDPARRLRERVLGELSAGTRIITLDFRSVERATSSFLDELLGRLAKDLGSSALGQKIRVAGMSELIGRMANVVIHQRLEGLSGPTRNSDTGG